MAYNGSFYSVDEVLASLGTPSVGDLRVEDEDVSAPPKEKAGSGRSNQRSKGKGKAKPRSVTRASDGQEGITPSTKTKHCAPRLITIIANMHRERFIALAETKPSRGALEAKATRAHNSVWQAIRDDFVNPDADVSVINE